MPPSTPKRPSRARQPERPPASRRKPELPFDDEQPLTGRSSRGGQGLRTRRRDHGEPPADDGDEDNGTQNRPTTPGGPDDQKFMEAYLYIERGPGAGQALPLQQGLTFIGRASTSGLRIQHASVSRRHAQLTRNGDRFFIRDLASQNGTYVNQIRIDREVEIFPGDELVMGTAQLRLRGPQGASEEAGARPRPSAHGRKRGSGATGVAIAAGAVGFGLAAVVMFFWFRISRGPSYEELARAPQPKPVVMEVTPVEVEPVDPQPSAQTPAERGPPEKPADTRMELNPVDIRPETAPAEAKVEVREETERPVIKRVTKSPAASRVAKRTSQPRASQKTDDGPSPAGDPTILARFEAGNLQAAVELAKKKGARELLGRLTRFQELYEAGQRALASQNEAGALKNLDAALKQAEDLSGGWDKYSIELRHQLSGLHLMNGTRLMERDPLAARKALNTALQYDPENTKAKEQLAKLDPSAAPPRKPGSKDDPTRSEIDEAFGR